MTIETRAKPETKPESVAPVRTLRIAYIMSRFPKLTETFVFTEMLAMEQLGHDVEIYPLQKERSAITHSEVEPLVARANFSPWFSLSILLAQFQFLIARPLAYLSALWTVLRANFGSRRYFAGAVLFFPKAVWMAARMKHTGVDRVHAHFASHPAMVGWVIHQLTGIPWSFTAHGSDLHRDQHMLAEKTSSADPMVVISDYNRQFLLSHCPNADPSKVSVVHCGVTPDDYGQKRLEKRETDPLRIACVGTLHEVKGQRYLIEACAQLAARECSVTCRFIGDGEDRGELESLTKGLGITDRVSFLGQQTREEVRDVLLETDVLIAPSVRTACGRREGIPVVLMEALASGAAVVGSDLSGIPELIEHEVTGLLVPPRDAEAIAIAIERLADNPWLRDDLADEGRSRVKREFNVNRNAAILTTLFTERTPPSIKETSQ